MTDDRIPVTVFDWPDDTPLGQVLGEAIGYASMCWSGTPSGVFDDEKAGDLVIELLVFLTRRDGPT